MLSYAFVDGFTRVERHDAISRLKAAIAAADGVIVDFAFFSTEAIRLTVELEGGAVRRLHEALSDAGVELFDKCASELARAERELPPKKPVVVMLHVAFLRGDPESVESARPAL